MKPMLTVEWLGVKWIPRYTFVPYMSQNLMTRWRDSDQNIVHKTWKEIYLFGIRVAEMQLSVPG